MRKTEGRRMDELSGCLVVGAGMTTEDVVGCLLAGRLFVWGGGGSGGGCVLSRPCCVREITRAAKQRDSQHKALRSRLNKQLPTWATVR